MWLKKYLDEGVLPKLETLDNVSQLPLNGEIGVLFRIKNMDIRVIWNDVDKRYVEIAIYR